jgi:hypothetical protein
MYDDFQLAVLRAMDAAEVAAGDLALAVLVNPDDRASSERVTQLQAQHKNMSMTLSYIAAEWRECESGFAALGEKLRKQIEYGISNSLLTARTMALAVHDKDPTDSRYLTERALALGAKGTLDGYRQMLELFDAAFPCANAR